jgi:hypothetical protein
MSARRGINSKATKDALLALLAHENTRTFLGKLAGGEDLRRATAELAGAAITTKVAQVLGASVAGAKAARDVTPEGPGASGRQPPHTAPHRGDVVDAEFVEINVTEQAKKAAGKK